MLALALGKWDVREKMLLASAFFLFLHFYEEFGFPGGFPWVGMHVERGITDTDSSKWTLNDLNAMYGNFIFALLVYILPLFLPNVRVLTLAAAIFAFVEVLGHLFVFNIALKDFYNPGLITSVFGLLPISICFFAQNGISMFKGWDWVLAFAWIVFNYWLAFLSPISKWMLKFNDRYAFTQEEVMRGSRYINRCSKKR